MINKVIDILNKSNSISGWLINQTQTKSAELFFIKKDLQMNRKKDVTHLSLTVYKDFTKDGNKYKGSSKTDISPGMEEAEIISKIEDAAYAASFVQNPYYDLVKPTDDKLSALKSKFSSDELAAFMPDIVKAVYDHDVHENGKINSCEFFLEAAENTVVNSNGVNESYTSYRGEIELVVDWKEAGEEVEVIEEYNFSDLDKEKLGAMVKKAFQKAEIRATAKKIYDLGDIPIVLTGVSAKELLSFYVTKAATEMVYKKYSSAQIGDSIQGEKIKGDAVSIKMLPEIPNSVSSRYIDADGVKLAELTLYDNGILENYFGDSRHCQYLNVNTTGRIPNVAIAGGNLSKDDLLKGDCLEVISFSAFGINPLTGDFGGEIRLAKHHSGTEIIPITGGSVTGNISNVQANMQLSSETDTIGNYDCPVAIKIKGAQLSS